jgi:hypothetical protein
VASAQARHLRPDTGELTASLTAGDPFGVVPEVSGSLRLLSIRVLDQNLDPLESPTPLYYLSQSGASYQVEGATQVPEPGFTLPVLVGCLLLVFWGWIASASRGNRSVSAAGFVSVTSAPRAGAVVAGLLPGSRHRNCDEPATFDASRRSAGDLPAEESPEL